MNSITLSTVNRQSSIARYRPSYSNVQLNLRGKLTRLTKLFLNQHTLQIVACVLMLALTYHFFSRERNPDISETTKPFINYNNRSEMQSSSSEYSVAKKNYRNFFRMYEYIVDMCRHTTFGK